MSGASNNFATSSMSCSRPINDVGAPATEHAIGRPASCASAWEPSNRSLNSRARSSCTSRWSSSGVSNVRYDSVPSLCSSSIRVVRPRLSVRRGRLHVQQPWQRSRQPELVLETRDVHVRPDPSVALPIQADEDVGLREVRPIELARRMRPSTELEHDRRQPEGRDRGRAPRRARRPARPMSSSRTRAAVDPACGSLMRRCRLPSRLTLPRDGEGSQAGTDPTRQECPAEDGITCCS